MTLSYMTARPSVNGASAAYGNATADRAVRALRSESGGGLAAMGGAGGGYISRPHGLHGAGDCLPGWRNPSHVDVE